MQTVVNTYITNDLKNSAVKVIAAYLVEHALTTRELEVLTEVIFTGNGCADESARIIIAEKMDISSFNLNNYIKKLKDRKLIQANDSVADDFKDLINLSEEATVITLTLVPGKKVA